MNLFKPARLAPVALAIAMAALAACSTDTPPPPPPPVAVIPPPPPPVTLSSRVIEQASAWHSYMLRAASISPAFPDGPSIAQSLRVGESYEPKQFLGGAVAYGTVVALQDPTFVAGVRKFVGDPTQRNAMVEQIIADPNYVRTLDGADSAANQVVAAIGDAGLKVYQNGKAVKQAAYTVQYQKWSKETIPDRDGRLALAKSLSTQPLQGDMAEIATLTQASLGQASLGLTPQTPANPWTPVVTRSVALAALAALGAAGDENMPRLQTLLEDPNTGYCLSMAKLNLYQCLAVAKPHYEDVFCLGQHVLMDTGQCMIKTAGAAMPVEPIYLPPAKPVPVAKTSIQDKPRPKPKKK
ncbi:hypothetical protein QO010_003836 [Caulobacter ginsengisoli]|uniref:Lipoprotein n=1 Tax=Caulobacter ginsengisoli TaxID=400775 RepID=A0ABU0IVK8_9CAUL|nr:hypothetical protein [Caulobacter ginsengisoli]MDQ0466043.1 hypothetical protein [Caulobacter ginsengisoli]